MNLDLGIFQFIVDLAPVKAFAGDHPIYYGIGAFVAGASMPRLWTSFLKTWLPQGTIKAIRFLKARGMTKDQLKELDKAVETIDAQIDAEIAAEEAAEKAQADNKGESK